MRRIVLIAHNIRSAHNVGSLLRTADGLGIERVYLTGYTPYPAMPDDTRLPHLALKINKQIAKTALGAEQTVAWRHSVDIQPIIANLRQSGFEIVALEQAPSSIDLADFKPPARVALVVGNELDGIDSETLNMCSVVVQIPMQGKKESFNVAVAAGIALYHFSQ